MRVFNEETNKNYEVLLLLKNKEVKTIIEAIEEACKNRPKKISWRNILDIFESKTCIY